jgi:hypothetical protein
MLNNRASQPKMCVSVSFFFVGRNRKSQIGCLGAVHIHPINTNFQQRNGSYFLILISKHSLFSEAILLDTLAKRNCYAFYVLHFFQTAILTVVLLPIRVSIICFFLISGWLLACLGLWGLTEEDLRAKPLAGWRR